MLFTFPTGQLHRFQRFQSQVPPTQQPPLLDLPGVTDHTSLTRERHLDCPERADRGLGKASEDIPNSLSLNS